jgi:hypothetical protein
MSNFDYDDALLRSAEDYLDPRPARKAKADTNPHAVPYALVILGQAQMTTCEVCGHDITAGDTH